MPRTIDPLKKEVVATRKNSGMASGIDAAFDASMVSKAKNNPSNIENAPQLRVNAIRCLVTSGQ